MEGWKQRPVHNMYRQVLLQTLSRFQLRILLILTLKKKKVLFLKHHLEIYIYEERKHFPFSWVPKVTLFDCTELMSIYPALHHGLIEVPSSFTCLYLSFVILCLSKLDGVLNEGLENIQLLIMLLQSPLRQNAWNERKATGEGKLQTLLSGLKPTPLLKAMRAAEHKGGNTKTYCHHLKNIITCLKSRKLELRPTRAPFSSCRWFLCTMDWKEEAPEMGSTDHMTISPCSLFLREPPWWWPRPALLQNTHSTTRLSPANPCWQQGAPIPQGPQASCSSAATQHQPNILIQKSAGVNPTALHIPHTKPHQHGAATGTLPRFPTAPLMARECAPAPWMGRNHSVHHVGRQGFLHPAKPGHCSKTPLTQEVNTVNNC